MMRAGIRKDESVTVARFLSGLSLEIRDKVELLPYRDFHDLVQICIKVEQQVLRKGPSQSPYSNYYSKSEYKREEKSLKEKPRENPTKATVQKSGKRREEPTSSNRSSDIKCFKFLGQGHVKSQCPSMRTILLRGQNLYISEEEIIEENTSKDSECENCEDAYPYSGELLLMRNSNPLGTTHRENIFQTNCQIFNKNCSLIVNSGSCYNFCSIWLVKLLKLNTEVHPQPYKLSWIQKDGNLIVSQQVKVKLSIGQYSENVLCDLVPLEACDILLGRPWQFEHNIIYHSRTNKITFIHLNNKFVISSLSPSQMVEDQLQTEERIENCLAQLGQGLQGMELRHEKLDRKIEGEIESERKKRKEHERKEKPLAKTEPNIEFSPTEISCEKFIEEKLLFRIESDIDINSSFIERTCEEFPREKLDIQKIRLPHRQKIMKI